MQQQFAIPEITKNLIIINLLMFLATISLEDIMVKYCVVYYIENERFQPYQLVTAFFMHGDITHIFFNMLVLFMFGSEVERALGPKRFLFLFLSAGFGANLLNILLNYLQVHQLMANLSPEQIAWATGQLKSIRQDLVVPEMQALGNIWFSGLLGASGATYGILFTFGTLYPNRIIHLLIPPIPIQAKYLVLVLACTEFYLHASHAQTGIGHFVHLSGGAIAILIMSVWRHQGARF